MHHGQMRKTSIYERLSWLSDQLDKKYGI